MFLPADVEMVFVEMVCVCVEVGDGDCSQYYVRVSSPSLSQAARLAQADGHMLPYDMLRALTFLWFPRQCFLTAT